VGEAPSEGEESDGQEHHATARKDANMYRPPEKEDAPQQEAGAATRQQITAGAPPAAKRARQVNINKIT
jgi:hypothetical protein